MASWCKCKVSDLRSRGRLPVGTLSSRQYLDCLGTGNPCSLTNTKVNSALHPSGVAHNKRKLLGTIKLDDGRRNGTKQIVRSS